MSQGIFWELIKYIISKRSFVFGDNLIDQLGESLYNLHIMQFSSMYKFAKLTITPHVGLISIWNKGVAAAG